LFTELNTTKPRIHDYLHFSDIKKEFLIQEGEQGRGWRRGFESQAMMKPSKSATDAVKRE
jgi:hypothetical protein